MVEDVVLGSIHGIPTNSYRGTLPDSVDAGWALEGRVYRNGNVEGPGALEGV